MKIYLVGGAVRDKILGLEPKDLDYVVVGSTSEEMIKLGFIPVGTSFPVFLHPETKDEYALARTELKKGEGYQGFDCSSSEDVTLIEDLARRDLTINAIALDVETGIFIDPFNGMSDLKVGLLKPTTKSFSEDPVRVLRLARFAARYGFKIDKEAKTLVKDLKEKGELAFLNNERVFLELTKVFKEKNPNVFFETLLDLDVLEVLFPELNKLVGVPQSKIYHPEGCAFTHTMLVLKKCREQTADSTLLLACLLHDLGKGITPLNMLPRHIGHEESGKKLVQSFCSRFNIGKSKLRFIKLFTKLHLSIHRCEEMRPTKVVKLLLELGCLNNITLLKSFIICAKSDSLGKNNKGYTQEKFLINVFNELQLINNKTICEKETDVTKIKEKLHLHRIKAVKKIKSMVIN